MSAFAEFRPRGARACRHLAAVAAVLLLGASSVDAQEMITVVVDKAQLVRLDADAVDLVIGDEAGSAIFEHALPQPRQLYLLGRSPGETNLYVLDEEGNEIFYADVVVVPNSQRRVTVNRGVAEAILTCAPRCTPLPAAAPPGAAAPPPAPSAP